MEASTLTPTSEALLRDEVSPTPQEVAVGEVVANIFPNWVAPAAATLNNDTAALTSTDTPGTSSDTSMLPLVDDEDEAINVALQQISSALSPIQQESAYVVENFMNLWASVQKSRLTRS